MKTLFLAATNQQVSPITLHFRFLNLRCAPKDLRNWLSVEMEASPQRKRPKLEQWLHFSCENCVLAAEVRTERRCFPKQLTVDPLLCSVRKINSEDIVFGCGNRSSRHDYYSTSVVCCQGLYLYKNILTIVGPILILVKSLVMGGRKEHSIHTAHHTHTTNNSTHTQRTHSNCTQQAHSR